MDRGRRAGLGLILGLALALAWGLAGFARMPTPDDIALARFVAMGGTAGDLCSKGDPAQILAGLEKACAPVGVAMLAPPGAARLSRFGRVRRAARRRGAIRVAGRRWQGAAARGPPPAA